MTTTLQKICNSWEESVSMWTYHEEKSGTCALWRKLIRLLYTNTAPIIRITRRNVAFTATSPLPEKSLSKYKDEVKPLRENPASSFSLHGRGFDITAIFIGESCLTEFKEWRIHLSINLLVFWMKKLFVSNIFNTYISK